MKRFRGAVALILTSAFAVVGVSDARAQDVNKMGGALVNYEAEVKQIGAAVTSTQSLGTRKTDQSQRRLISAQVAFGVGDYDDAAIMLYDIVDQGASNRSYEEALYYLAESLFQKKDYMGSRTYFAKLVDFGPSGDFYQQALERLVELSLKLHDDTDVATYLQALDNVPASKQRDSVPYVRGRYLYFSEDYTGSIAQFEAIPRTSEYYVRSQYFAGAAHIAGGNLAEASKIYEALIRGGATGETATEEINKRVVELSHMALGRIFYERDQASKAIDQYLMVSRKSDLFDEALYEVAWVYVKDKQFDKALRALELLQLANPQSSVQPDVRILEGNLRIRKARMVEDTGKGNSLEEYTKAMAVFIDTRDTYEDARAVIERIVAEHEDPRKFVNQITGRTSETFDIEAQLPPVAVEWLRQEAEVSRVIDVDTDLVTIRSDIEEGETTIRRLEAAIESPSRVNIFPELAEKRGRLTEIFENVQKMRGELAAAEGDLVAQNASASERSEYENLRKQRQDLAAELDALRGKGNYTERVAQARGQYAELDKRAQEIAVLIDVTKATLVAVEKYLSDEPEPAEGDAETAAQRAEYEAVIDELKTELLALTKTLETVRGDITLATDQAGIGDESAVKGAELREEYRAALDAEHALLAGIVSRMTGANRTKAEQIGNLITKGGSVLGEIDIVNRTIDGTIDRELAEVRAAITEEKQRLVGYREELETYEVEAQTLGGDVLSNNFGKVSQKFYEVLIRSDVGVIDVAWASRENAETTLKRLTLEESRERRVLQEQFGDVATTPPPGADGIGPEPDTGDAGGQP